MKHFLTNILLYFGLSVNLLAQTTLDTIYLPEVKLIESKIQTHSIGSKTETISTILLGESKTQTLADFLTKNGSIFIKQYGALATPAFRGTAASHTLFLWNDIPLNSLSTGMIDMGLLPANCFDQLQVAYGGSSSIFGSGAIGGSIHLDNIVAFQKKQEIKLAYEVGSFGLKSRNLELKHANKRNFLKVIYSKVEDENNFSFINTVKRDNPLEYNKHAMVKSENLQAVFGFQYNTKNRVETHFWKVQTEREIPSNMTVPNSTAMQYDDANRFLLKSSHSIGGGTLKLKQALMKEDFNYVDKPKNIDSKILAKNYISNADYNYCLRYFTFNVGAAFTNNNIESNNYKNGKREENEKAVYSSFQTNFKGFSSAISIRKQMHSTYVIPLIPSVGIHQKLTDFLSVRAKTNKNFRSPTFNERFWAGLGNADLLTENGWSHEAGFDVKLKGLTISATAFSLKVQDWIQWMPNAVGIWNAENIKQVWSRGIEGNCKIKVPLNKAEILLIGNYQYNQSTNEKGISALDNSISKQLIYTPFHKGNLIFILKENNFQLSINQSYNGSVFTTSDNKESLEAYLLCDVALLYQFQEAPLSFQLTIKNIRNKTYQPYKNYPAAGRELLLTLNYIIN
ncbi:MAG: TonB-dependent receptor [Flavobacteriales bacterium]|nr:TonB-dependent receptor [Flavobacteriales bacterium]